ncbi:MAG: hypothetical protein KAI70_03975 [Candidatus Omnitrophica bacterium]|nr:hypothetical protein [Candidatus Omnitrophota bacterium]
MRRIGVVLTACMVLGFFLMLPVSRVFGHTPLCSCWDNGDGTITCEGGFSDGSSGTGIAVRVIDKNDEKVLIAGKMDEDSEFTFNNPGVPYKVHYDAGPGHLVEIDGDDITE